MNVFKQGVVSHEKTYYTICELCGAHLDPGERCDCLDDEPEPV